MPSNDLVELGTAREQLQHVSVPEWVHGRNVEEDFDQDGEPIVRVLSAPSLGNMAVVVTEGPI